jgi:hypothetical protein
MILSHFNFLSTFYELEVKRSSDSQARRFRGAIADLKAARGSRARWRAWGGRRASDEGYVPTRGGERGRFLARAQRQPERAIA